MQELWLEIINSDWHGYRGNEPEQDRLLQSEWIEQVMAQNEIQVTTPLEAETIAALQAMRSLMQRIVEAFARGDFPQAQDIVTLNSYLAAVPSVLYLERKGDTYHLEQAPLESDWHWLLREIAASFATFVVQYDSSGIKRCNNPACRWVFYDRSRTKNQYWCNDRCANLMRVRRFRAKHKKTRLDIHD